MKTSKVKLYINGVLQSSHPIYSENISVEHERDSQGMYYRTKMDSAFTFVRDDYDAIYGAGIDDDFELEVYDNDALVARATFEKTDCAFDTDNRICEVKASSLDQYQKILNGINNEYDLVQLAPERETITLTKRAIIQLYVKGDTKVTNLVGNTSYEIDANSNVEVEGQSVPVEELTTNDILLFHFLLLKYTLSIDVKAEEGLAALYPLLNGVYSGTKENNEIILTNQNGYYIKINHTPYTYFAFLYTNNDVLVTYNARNVGIGYSWDVTKDYPDSITDGLKATASGSTVSCGEATHRENSFFSRMLFDHIPSGQSYDKVPENDICANNLNYRYVAGLNILGMSSRVVISNEVQDEPTKWGVNGDGKYYVKPKEPSFIIEPNAAYIPIGWNVWIPSSYWFLSSSNLDDAISIFNTPFDLMDAYPLWSAINVLLGKIDKDVVFEGTSDYSQFLYGNVTTMDAYVKQLLYITPITNVKKTYYSQAARKGKITLGQIFDMLKNTAQLYWFIDDGKLRIEHISWFKNGGSYAQANPLVDLTEIKSPMSMKSWDFGTNTITYDKGKIIKRYEFGWNDECTEAFDGYSLDVRNEYARNGKTYKANVGNFISDIDLIVSSPDRVSDDCFALIGVNPSTKICPIVGIGALGHNMEIPTHIMQNAYLSFLFLELAYWKYDLGGDYVTMEDTKTLLGTDGFLNVVDTQRIRKQSVKFPKERTEVADQGILVHSSIPIGKQGLIRTPLGDGEWSKSTYTIEDGMVAMELYLPETDNALYSASNFTANGVTMEKNGNEIVLNGNRISKAWGYFRIKANKPIKVTLTASTEANYDLGWENEIPFTNRQDAKQYASNLVSGTNSIDFTLAKGDATFIGYAKDTSVEHGEDKIFIEIEEI